MCMLSSSREELDGQLHLRAGKDLIDKEALLQKFKVRRGSALYITCMHPIITIAKT